MRTGLIAYKIGMTRVFENNAHVPVTILKIDNCKVLDVKTLDRDGYVALQLGAGQKREKNIKKPVLGHLKKSNSLSRNIREFRVSEDCLLNIGDELLPSHFIKGQFVDVSGKTIGRGFSGGMRRWNFRGLEDSHGVSVSHRSVGSTGQCQDPGRVFKGKKMPGHYGNENITLQNLLVVETDDENGYIMVRGSVPGSKGAVLYIKDAVKKVLSNDVPFPAGIKTKENKVSNATEVAE